MHRCALFRRRGAVQHVRAACTHLRLLGVLILLCQDLKEHAGCPPQAWVAGLRDSGLLLLAGMLDAGRCSVALPHKPLSRVIHHRVHAQQQEYLVTDAGDSYLQAYGTQLIHTPRPFYLHIHLRFFKAKVWPILQPRAPLAHPLSWHPLPCIHMECLQHWLCKLIFCGPWQPGELHYVPPRLLLALWFNAHGSAYVCACVILAHVSYSVRTLWQVVFGSLCHCVLGEH